MKVIKTKEQSLLYKSFGAAGQTHLAAAILVYFDLQNPDPVLTEQELWSEISPELGQGEYLDSCMPKARGEFLVKGGCYAPEGQTLEAASVAVKVGRADKRLLVFGDRYWEKGRPTKATRFSEMPIIWERALGGPDFERNPKGRGRQKVLTPDGGSILPLPNVENPDHLVLDPAARPDPAGFGMIDPTWPQRRKKEGTFDKKWQEKVMPDLPEDTAEDYFNAALPDQQIQGFFKPGDPILIENMHPRFQVIKSSLPQVRVRFFLTAKKSLKPEDQNDLVFKEVESKIDTVWLFPKLMRGVLIFRVVTTVLDDEYEDLVRMYLVSEDAREEPRSIEHYQEEEKKLLDRSAAIDPAPLEKAEAAVASAMLRVRNTPKMLEEARQRALGQAPLRPNSPEDMALLKNMIIGRSLANLDRLETRAIQIMAKNRHRVDFDLSKFDQLRNKLNQTSQQIDQALARGAQAQQNTLEIKKNMGVHLKETLPPEKVTELVEAGIDPDNLLPGQKNTPWHERGFHLVNQWRNRLLWSEGLRIKLLNLGLTNKTIKRAWLGEIPEPWADDPVNWGLESWLSLHVPSGLVIPRFQGPILTGITVRPDELTEPGQDVIIPGSKPESRVCLPDGPGPIVRITDELEALFLEQEVGDAVGVAAMADEKAPLPEQADKIIAEAGILIIILPEGARQDDDRAQAWLEKFPRARLVNLPFGKNLFEARAKGLEIRDWILTLLPREFQEEHRLKPDLKPGRSSKGSPLAGVKRPSLNVKEIVRNFSDGVKGALQPKKAEMQTLKADLTEKYERMLLESGTTRPEPPPPFSGATITGMGESIIRELKAFKDHIKAKGFLAPDIEEKIDAEAARALSLSQQGRARYEAGSARLSAALEKAAAAREAARARKPGEKMQARLEASGLDEAAGRQLDRDEVVRRLEQGRSLKGSNLNGLDLSGLDFSDLDLSRCQCRKTIFREANLTGARLNRVIANEADFQGAVLSRAALNRAVCSKACFVEAKMDGAKLTQTVLKEADLSRADLTGAGIRQCVLEKSVLLEAVFSGAEMEMAVFVKAQAMGSLFNDAVLKKCLFQKIPLDRINFSRAIMTGCLFQEAVGEETVFNEVRMNKCGLLECDLPAVGFKRADLSGSYFRGCKMPLAFLSRAVLNMALFTGCDLSKADLTGATAKRARLVRCNLEGARLVAVNLFLGSLRKSRLVDADLKGSNLFSVDFFKSQIGRTDFSLANLKNTPLYNRTDLL